MKRVLLVIICLILVFPLASCSEAEQPLTVAELLELGEKYLLEHDYQQALIYFLGVIEVEPRTPRGYTGAAEAYIGLDRINDAIAILRQGLTVLPGNPEITEMLAEIYRGMERLDEEKALIQEGLRTSPDHPDLTSRLSEVEELLHTHIWVDADCFNPKTCSDCGETEGGPNKHAWRDANFQEPQICTVCGETEGEPLIPCFIAHGYQVNASLGVTYPYRTITYEDPSLSTVGQATFSDFRVFESGEGLDAREGYEYQSLTLTIIFDDNNARRAGMAWYFHTLDYYHFDPSYVSETFTDDGVASQGSVSTNGVEQETFVIHDTTRQEWDRRGRVFTVVIEFLVFGPAGYDGFMVSLHNAGNNPGFAPQAWGESYDSDSIIIRPRS
jgi:tetratricopeptide (TPR) repeat protein